MKKTLLLAFFVTAATASQAQTYSEKAAGIQKLVWAGNQPEFNLTEVPDKYKNESAVVLAQSYTMQRTSNLKLKYLIITAAVANRVTKVATYHERVKINDKSALESYSTLEYQKRLDNSVSLLIAKVKDLHETYIGAKIIKPNGQVTIINTGEEVLLKNTNNDKKGKLAIPGLQVGDILDYYVHTNDMTEKPSDDSFSDNDQIFVLAEEYPVLNYSLFFQYNSKSNTQYISANGAPKFQEGKLDNGDKTLSLTIKDMPKYQSQKWTSVYRQYPYIEISSTSKSSALGMSFGTGKSGLADNRTAFESYFNERIIPVDDESLSMLKDYFGGKKQLKAAPLDSSMKVLYDIWKLRVFGSYSKSDLDDMSRLNYRTAVPFLATIQLSRLLTDMDIPHEVLLVAPRNGNSLDNVYNFGDFATMIRVANGRGSLYMAFDDALTHFNQIPAKFQGEKVISVTPRRKNAQVYLFDENISQPLPVTSSDKNTVHEQLQVAITTDMQKLRIQRAVKQTGDIRDDDQKALLSAMEIDAALAATVKGDPLEKRLSKNPETKRIADAFLSGMGKTQSDIRESFLKEAKEKYEQDPVQITDYKVTKSGLTVAQPEFEYTSTVILNNMVKKAGNGFIVDVGKLAGTFLKLEEKDRKRTLDVYMPCARTFKYNISFTVPAGYKVSGLEELNKQKVNKTGSFTSAATLKGNVLNLDVTRIYNHNFEKGSDWPLVAELVDAGFAFNNQKILLEK